MTKMEQQLKIEKEAFDYSYNKFMDEVTKRIQSGNTSELMEGKVLLKTTIDIVATKLQEYFKAPLRGNNKKARMVLEDYYDRPHDLALLVLTTIINTIGTLQSPTVVQVTRALSVSLHDDYYITKLKKNEPKLYSHIEREYKKRGNGYIHSRKTKLGKMKAVLANDDMSKLAVVACTDLLNIVDKSGCNLLKLKTIFVKDKKSNIVTFTPEASELILQARELNLLNFIKYPILVVEPKEWSSFDGSLGYYSDSEIYRGSFVKARHQNKKLLRKFLVYKDCNKYLKVLNHISKTSWRINKRVYDTIKDITSNNMVDIGSPRDNPTLIGGLPFNRHQDASDYVNVHDYGEVIQEGKHKGKPADRVKYKEWFKACEIQKEKILINMSKAISLNLAMVDAEAYYNEPNIYFSYQADFRSRIYPVQQHLNPQGKGVIKALLEFSKGYPIENDEQLYWFKIHGANCLGYDKLEYEERVNEIDKREEEIHLISSDPIRYRESWSNADEPFLYLAWCFEYSEYLKHPSTFRSHIPIALDATCSGLQIYSGLLLDVEGAGEVNVVGNTRKDIYQKVATRVNGYLDKGEYDKTIIFKKSDGSLNECDTVAEANSMKGKVSRKLTKRNVMTQPYSVTSFGMYQQLIEQLDEMESVGNVPWVGDKWVLARLLTKLNDRAIVETVRGARVGQEFLKDITKTVCKGNNYIFYTTPYMDFPVLQRINKYKTTRIQTELGKLSLRQNTDEIHQIKMVNGIAPNYIHSLDSTLMFLTIEDMMDSCSDFHLIHDSFGVSVGNVIQLNKSIRDSFIKLFGSSPLKSFVNQVCKSRVDEVDGIMLNTLDINEVANSKYIFS